MWAVDVKAHVEIAAALEVAVDIIIHNICIRVHEIGVIAAGGSFSDLVGVLVHDASTEVLDDAAHVFVVISVDDGVGKGKGDESPAVANELGSYLGTVVGGGTDDVAAAGEDRGYIASYMLETGAFIGYTDYAVVGVADVKAACAVGSRIWMIVIVIVIIDIVVVRVNGTRGYGNAVDGPEAIACLVIFLSADGGRVAEPAAVIAIVLPDDEVAAIEVAADDEGV